MVMCGAFSRVAVSGRALRTAVVRSRSPVSRKGLSVQAHTVEITFEGKKHTLEVSEDENILEVARDAGLDLPCDCMMGVCMTCPAKLVCGASYKTSQSKKSVDISILCVSACDMMTGIKRIS